MQFFFNLQFMAWLLFFLHTLMMDVKTIVPRFWVFWATNKRLLFFYPSFRNLKYLNFVFQIYYVEVAEINRFRMVRSMLFVEQIEILCELFYTAQE